MIKNLTSVNFFLPEWLNIDLPCSVFKSTHLTDTLHIIYFSDTISIWQLDKLTDKTIDILELW